MQVLGEDIRDGELRERVVTLDSKLLLLRQSIVGILPSLVDPATRELLDDSTCAVVEAMVDVGEFFDRVSELLDLEAAIGALNVHRLEQRKLVLAELKGVDLAQPDEEDEEEVFDEEMQFEDGNDKRPYLIRLDEWLDKLAIGGEDESVVSESRLLRQLYLQAKTRPFLDRQDEVVLFERYKKLKVEALTLLLRDRKAVVRLAALFVPKTVYKNRHVEKGGGGRETGVFNFQFFISHFGIDSPFGPFALLERGYKNGEGEEFFGEEALLAAIDAYFVEERCGGLDIDDDELVDFGLSIAEIAHLVLQYVQKYLASDTEGLAHAGIPDLLAAVFKINPNVSLFLALKSAEDFDEREQEVFAELKEIEAQMIFFFLRNILFWLKSFVRRGEVSTSDGVQFGLLGFRRAIDKYDYRSGHPFYRYMYHDVVATISTGILLQSDFGHVGRGKLNDVKVLKRIIAIAHVVYEGDTSPEKLRELLLAEDRDWSIESIEELLEIMRFRDPLSLDIPLGRDSDKRWIDAIPEDGPNPEDLAIANEGVWEKWLVDAKLTHRESFAVVEIVLKGRTYAGAAADYVDENGNPTPCSPQNMEQARNFGLERLGGYLKRVGLAVDFGFLK